MGGGARKAGLLETVDGGVGAVGSVVAEGLGGGGEALVGGIIRGYRRGGKRGGEWRGREEREGRS